MSKLTDKIVVITGASSGIGERLAYHAARNGAITILVARNKKILNNMAQSLNEKFGKRCHVFSCDIGDPDAWQTTLKKILSEFDRIDALINNAGFGVFETVAESSFTSFKNMFDVNVLGLIQGVRIVIPQMIDRKRGHIINIASQAGKMATPKAAGYSASKHAVLGFTNALRLEVEKDGVFVTAVNLGPVRTNFFKTADPEGKYQKAVSRYMLDPDTIAQRVTNQLFQKKREINLPSWMEFGSKCYQLFPNIMEFLLRKQFNKK